MARRRKWWLWGSLATVSLLSLGAFTLLVPEAGLSPEKRRLQSLGIPVTREDFAKMTPQGTNAAELIEEAGKAAGADFAPRGADLTPQRAAEIARARVKSYELAKEGVKMDRCIWLEDWSKMLDDPIIGRRYYFLEETLPPVYATALDRIYKRNLDGALEAIAVLDKLFVFIGMEPTQMAQLAYYQKSGLTELALRKALIEFRDNSAALVKILDYLDARPALPDSRYRYMTDFLFTEEYYWKRYTLANISDKTMVPPVEDRWKLHIPSEKKKVVDRLAEYYADLFSTWPDEHFYSGALEKSFLAANKAIRKSPEGGLVLRHVFYDGSDRSRFRLISMRRVTMAAAEVLLSRTANSVYPSSLPVRQNTVDALSGKPFSYKVTPKGFEIRTTSRWATMSPDFYGATVDFFVEVPQ